MQLISPIYASPVSSQEKPQSSPETTMHCASAPRNTDEYRQQLHKFARDIAKPLSTYETPFVSHQLLQKFGVKFCSLDFVTGTPSNGSQQFISPAPVDHVAKCLSISQPWLGGGNLTDFHSVTWNSDCGEAKYFYSMLRLHWNGVGVRDQSLPNLLKCSPWKPFTNRHKILRQYAKQKWEAKDIFRYCTLDKEGRYTPILSVPHMITFVAGGARLREGEVTVGEMTTILWLAIIFCMSHMSLQTKVIPITVISACWRSVRVVQGVVNVPENTVEIRMTPIINFEEGVKKNWTQFLTLLGWFVGKPMGVDVSTQRRGV